MALAIFDLDNTLIANDSDYLWGEFMCDHGLVDAGAFRQANQRFYEQYEQAELDVDAYITFSLEPLTKYSMEELRGFHEQFMEDVIRPIMLEKARVLLQKHRDQGDHLMIITATNRFVTAPIAEAFGVDTLLAIEAEVRDNHYTGETFGTPTYQAGKVTRLKEWLQDNPEYSMSGSHFYSDSKNDLPLLREVDHPFVVNPDQDLEKVAREEGWPVLNLR